VRFRRILLPAVIVSLLAAGVSFAFGGGPVAFAASSLHDVFSQLRRNSKVSERLNAGFFRAPQTQGYAGSAFRPTDSDTAFSVSSADGSLSLKPGGTTTTTTTTTTSTSTGTTGPVTGAQTSGTFEAPLQIPNRARVVKIQASYNDSAGNNTSPGGTQAPSGFDFEVVKYGLLGDNPTELLSQPNGIRSTDGKKTTAALALANNGFQVNNSSGRYVLRVTITDTNAATKFYGFTVQYVIGKGVAGAPA
jgi:hypothetical protein